jgi:hypothetical protein
LLEKLSLVQKFARATDELDALEESATAGNHEAETAGRDKWEKKLLEARTAYEQLTDHRRTHGCWMRTAAGILG